MNRKNISLAIIIFTLLSGCIQVRIVDKQSSGEQENPPTDLKTPTERNTFTPSQIICLTPSITPSISPSVTPSVTLSVTLSVTPSLSPDPETTPIVNTIEDAACYIGPGFTYPIISYIETGDQVLLVGKSIEGDWILVQETMFNKLCWLQDNKISVQSLIIETLPDATAPPTSTLTPVPSDTPTRQPGTKNTIVPYPPPYAPP